MLIRDNQQYIAYTLCLLKYAANPKTLSVFVPSHNNGLIERLSCETVDFLQIHAQYMRYYNLK